MNKAEKEQLILTGQTAADPVIGVWLAALADSRERTLKRLKGIDPALIDWQAPDGAMIGSTLYHIAAIELSWLYEDVLPGSEWTEEMAARFPYDVRDGEGHLTPVKGESLEAHLERLAWIRGKVIETYAAMSLEDFQRTRELDEYDVSPAWVVHHLLQHEAEHRSLIEKLGQEAKVDSQA